MAAAVSMILAGGAHAAQQERPNVIVIIADDMGYSDISPFGGEIPTPNLQAMAEQGMRMSQYYTSPMSAPARSMLLTGNSNQQAGMGTIAALVAGTFSGTAAAAGGSSGPRVTFAAQGKLGEIIVNPYKIAPLTAIIKNGGYEITEATVRIVPKKGGQEIKYKVSRKQLLTHAGIPVFGLYADYNNKVEVTYTRKFHGKTEKISETYTIYTAPVYHEVSGNPTLSHNMFETKVVKMDPKFSDRLYLVNNLMQQYAKATRMVWNNPMGGAMEWNFYPMNAIIDTKGEVRWYMHVEPIYDVEQMYRSGVMMGFQQDEDGNITWGYGQRYVKYDLMGREIYNRRLPVGYIDFSHSLDNAQNGHTFIRAASADLRRADNKRVRTVRDVIVEVDGNGQVVDEWRLWEILDPL